MLRLKALRYLLCFPKGLSINAKNFFPIFVCTFLLNGGLYHSIFRLRFLEIANGKYCGTTQYRDDHQEPEHGTAEQ